MTKLEKEELRKKYLELILSISNNKYYKDFIIFLFLENKFIYEVGFEDIKTTIRWVEEEKEVIVPFIKTKNYIFGFEDFGNDYIRFGIDPKGSFNKISQCSILIYFQNIKKREYERAKQLLKRIFNRKDKIFRKWSKMAGSCWYGEYALFGI